MSEEYEYETTTTSSDIFSSPFIPLLILLVGLLVSEAYDVFAANSQRNVYNQQFQSMVPSLQQAQSIEDRYVKLMKDLIDTSAKDQYAAQIVNEAKQSGLIRVQQPAPGDTGAAATSAPPAAGGSAPAK